MASFFPKEIPDTISLGATYRDYATFARKFEEYCKDTGYEFSTNSQTIESANKLIKNEEKHFAKRFKYISVQFVCKHKRRSERANKNTATLIGCPAMIRLSANRTKDVLEVTKFNDLHIHSANDPTLNTRTDYEEASETTQSTIDKHETVRDDGCRSLSPEKTFTPINIKETRKIIDTVAIGKAAKFAHKQLIHGALSKYRILSIVPGEIAEVTDGDEVYLLSEKLHTCSCVYNDMVHLPCSHIFAARQYMGSELFIESMIPEQYRKDYEPHYGTEGQSTEEKKLMASIELAGISNLMEYLEKEDVYQNLDKGLDELMYALLVGKKYVK
ncbi:hypothetical protein CAPTEDRAFT_185827 [Capitella teleta]|uniref:SWIM-type domain-containing protein n=1 Tax=Capitella teleta TaxID=283909 RepID=R7UK50_CAPTE|nr:hypothetical protein CAPTEDRAFT_185827 [Capitella teleta]|eukprot:ELU06550.1 hypothetical protein CAPTEDRAFT_185827 [Capitella teleta]